MAVALGLAPLLVFSSHLFVVIGCQIAQVVSFVGPKAWSQCFLPAALSNPRDPALSAGLCGLFPYRRWLATNSTVGLSQDVVGGPWKVGVFDCTEGWVGRLLLWFCVPPRVIAWRRQPKVESNWWHCASAGGPTDELLLISLFPVSLRHIDLVYICGVVSRCWVSWNSFQQSLVGASISVPFWTHHRFPSLI